MYNHVVKPLPQILPRNTYLQIFTSFCTSRDIVRYKVRWQLNLGDQTIHNFFSVISKYIRRTKITDQNCGNWDHVPSSDCNVTFIFVICLKYLLISSLFLFLSIIIKISTVIIGLYSTNSGSISSDRPIISNIFGSF